MLKSFITTLCVTALLTSNGYSEDALSSTDNSTHQAQHASDTDTDTKDQTNETKGEDTRLKECASQLDCGPDALCFNIQYVSTDEEEQICQVIYSCDNDDDCDSDSYCTRAKVCIDGRTKIHSMRHLWYASTSLLTTLCSSDADCPTDRPKCKIADGKDEGRCVKDDTSVLVFEPIMMSTY